MTAADRSDALGNKLAWVVAVDEHGDWGDLHYVAGENADTWETWWDEGPWPVDRAAACGPIKADLPGVFSRMGRQRCPECCARLGITTGAGVPVNDDSCRPVGAPLAAWLQAKAAAVYADARTAAHEGDEPKTRVFQEGAHRTHIQAMIAAGVLPHRVRQRRSRGWRKPEGARSVTRPGRYGNPYRTRREFDEAMDARRRGVILDGFANYPTEDEIRADLAGADLMCWCEDGDYCHASTLLWIANL